MDVHARGHDPRHRPEAVNRAFQASFAVVTLWVGDRMAGFGRLISDGQTFASLHDIVVDAEFADKGFERRIIDALVSRAPEAQVIAPAGSDPKRALLRSLGFEPTDDVFFLPPSRLRASTREEPAKVPWAFGSLALEGPRARLRTLETEDLPDLAHALLDPSGSLAARFRLDSHEKLIEWLLRDLKAFESFMSHPILCLTKGEVLGYTRLLRVEPRNRTIELDELWTAPSWRRSPVTLEVRRLLLSHCFGSLRANRVELRAEMGGDRRAGSPLAGALEGTLRHRAETGDEHDGLIYSILRSEWPALEARLQAHDLGQPFESSMEARHAPPPPAN